MVLMVAKASQCWHPQDLCDSSTFITLSLLQPVHIKDDTNTVEGRYKYAYATESARRSLHLTLLCLCKFVHIQGFGDLASATSDVEVILDARETIHWNYNQGARELSSYS